MFLLVATMLPDHLLAISVAALVIGIIIAFFSLEAGFVLGMAVSILSIVGGIAGICYALATTYQPSGYVM
jgi:uncharacterized membrane protein HdeD (DUF308 family)